MLMILCSWLVIGIAALIFGKAIVDRIWHDDIKTMGKADIYIMTGLIFLNLYAQFFSLFYKVAGIACTILGVCGCGILISWAIGCIRRKENPVHVRYLKEHPYRTAALLLCILATMVWTAQVAGHYDTGLYHAQAIHWIEEYGVVPGLGNLHMRLAYNSAFMSLQALFSLQWLLGQSLHTLNGFLCVFGIGYAVMTIRRHQDQSWRTSDLLKCAGVIYIVTARYNISSSGTDIWALFLAVYVCTKWCEFAEAEVCSAAPWCFVCLTGIYALTVKLSAAVIVLLTVYPMYLLIRKRDIRRIAQNAVAAVLIVLPFLLRNVIISGYLIYPYAGIDLFQVDWKMDRSVLASDSMDIKMYGRGITDINEYGTPLSKWLPHWFGRQEPVNQILIAVGMICAIGLIYRLWKYICARQTREIIFIITVLLSLAFWFVTAPLMRYGIVYFMIVTAVFTGEMNKRKRNVNINRIVSAALVLVMIPVCWSYISKLGTLPEMEPGLWVKQEQYPAWPAVERQVGNVTVWVPEEGDLLGYFAFPGTSARKQLPNLGLRGDGFREGFCYMQETED